MYASADPAGVATGVISMWHGLIASIPSGWYLCNGLNGTPNLCSKFVRGAAAFAEAGSTGGNDTHTLTIDEMPAHTHGIDARTNASNSVGHVKATSEALDVNSLVTGSSGGGAAHNNMPAYYEVLYIMKG